MAITITTLPDSEDRWGKRPILGIQVTLDTPYQAGGYELDPAQFGYKSGSMACIVMGVHTAGVGYHYVWNTSTNHLQVYYTGAGFSGVLAEAVGTNLSSVVLELLLTGL
jgi:hypothetical protein